MAKKSSELADLEPAKVVAKKESSKKLEEEIEQLKKRISELEEENERLKQENEKLREENERLKEVNGKLLHDLNLLMKVAKGPIILKEEVKFNCLSYRVEAIPPNKFYILNQNEVRC